MPVELMNVEQASERMILASMKKFYPFKDDMSFEPVWWLLASHPSTPYYMIQHLVGVIARVMESMICSCDSECEESCSVAKDCDRLSLLLNVLAHHEVF